MFISDLTYLEDVVEASSVVLGVKGGGIYAHCSPYPYYDHHGKEHSGWNCSGKIKNKSKSHNTKSHHPKSHHPKSHTFIGSGEETGSEDNVFVEEPIDSGFELLV
jgi:hypothetical protein